MSRSRLYPPRLCEICQREWTPLGYPASVLRTCSQKCATKLRSRLLREVWKRPGYREQQLERVKEHLVVARAAAMVTFRNRPKPPQRKTPEGRYFRKLARILGTQAAREALGIGQ